MTIHSLCRTPYLSKHTSYDHVFCCTSLKCWHLQMLFKILILWVVRGCKRAKNGPKWQKSLCNSVSQELHFIWLWLLVHMCKMMISPAIFFLFFHFFKILNFQVFKNSSIIAKRKFWGVPAFFTCVWFLNCSNGTKSHNASHDIENLHGCHLR